MSKMLAVLMGILMTVPSCASGQPDNPRAVVDRVEGEYAVVEFSVGDTIKTLDILTEDINGDVGEGTEVPVKYAEGKFHTALICSDYQGNEDVYYQFKSDDDSVWWALTEDEIGYIPTSEDKYILYYTDNGTEKGDDVCDCLPEWDCECYLYDDIFFHVERVSTGFGEEM